MTPMKGGFAQFDSDDCVICLTSVGLLPHELNPDGSAIMNTDDLVKSKGYMLTPCNHKFH